MTKLPLVISVVIPTLKSSSWIANTLDALFEGHLYQIDEIIIVDDGSDDGTWDSLLELTERFPNLRAFRLRENMGQRKATIIGVLMAKGVYCITVDDDGKNPGEQIKLMASQLIDERHKFVYGKSTNSPNGVFRQKVGKVFRNVFSVITKNPNWKYQSSFRGFSNKEFKNNIANVSEDDSLDDLLLNMFGTPHVIFFEENHSGTKSRYNLKKLFSHGLGQIAATKNPNKSNQPIDISSLIIDQA